MGRDLSKDPVRLGILGCGSFMQRRILTALPETPSIRVVNLQKRDKSQAAAVAERFRIPRSTATRRDLLADPDVEAVFIGTPNALHEDDAIACAQAGKHALCEKPMATSAAGAQRMIEAFDRAGRLLLVGHCLRFKGAVLRARQILQSGQLGELRAVNGFYAFPQTAGRLWRGDWAMGGGVAADLAVHLVDLIRFVSGQEFASASAIADRGFNPPQGRADLTMRALMRLASGAMACVAVSYEEPFLNGFEVIGSKAALYGWKTLRQSYDPGEILRHVHDDGVTELRLTAGNVYADELTHFARVLAGEAKPVLGAAEGLANQRVIDAIYRSVQQKRECPVE